MNKAYEFWERTYDEEEGPVRLRTVQDEEGCEVWTGSPCEDCNNDNPPFVLIGEYRTLDGEWEIADSIGGMHLSWGRSWLTEVREDEAYIQDIMLATLEAAHRYARRFVEEGMPIA